MLLQFRKLSRGAAATIILGLVGLAMVAFLIPSGGIQMPGMATVAQVGGERITPAQLTRELELTLKNQRAQGADVTRQEAIDAGLHMRVLERLIARQAIFAYAKRLGVSASDAQVAEAVREMPGVTNPITGQFDQAAFEDFSRRQLQYEPDDLLEELRGDISIQMLMESLIGGVRAPSSFGALGLAYESETRVVSIAEAPASAVANVAAPTEAQLQMFWEENQETLRLPEFRALTLIHARTSDFAARVDIPEQRLRDEFEARRASLTRPERRTYVRIAAQSEAQANDAAARLGRGESADTVATALNLQVSRGADQARTDVPDPRVAEAVFATTPRSAPRVVRGQLTPWAVVQVESVTPAVAPDFAAIRDELRTAIANDEASELLNTAVTAFEESRAGGANVAEAARQNGLVVINVPAVEAGGRDTTGAPVEALQGQEAVLATAFETPEGEASDFIAAEDADAVIVSVDSVTPSRVRALDEVRNDLTQAWQQRERGRRLRELAQNVTDAVRGGQSFAAAARANRFNVVVSSRALDRRTAAQIPARGLAQQIFASPAGGVVSDIRADGGAILVATVEQINRVNPAEQPQAVEAVRLQVQQGLGASVGQAVQDEIVARARPRRNESVLQQVYPQQNEDGEDQAQ
jgi:peptidyl-prolyl cis-trans isomerase D